MININEEYRALVASVLHSGVPKKDRTGVGTKSLFGKQIIHDMNLGFPLLHIKKTSFDAAKTELLWILNGRTDLKYLEDNGVNYWRADYKRSNRADETLGPVHGYQWRNFNGVDQLYNLSKELKSNPNSRRLIVSAWNPADMKEMVLPPCHYGFQVYVRNNKLDLIWTQRSADVVLGLPYDIAMYGLLLSILALGHGYYPGKLIGQLGDCHIYNNHTDQAKTIMYRNPDVFNCPKLKIKGGGLRIAAKNKLSIPKLNQLNIDNYNHMGFIKAPLNVGK